MSISKEDLKFSFQSLSTRYGGSLLMKKQLLSQDEVVVFIGLGGLGGRAVNAIKAVAADKLDNPDRRFFLVVDTCKKDMNAISAVTAVDIEKPEEAELLNRGCIEEHEKLALYKESYKIKTLGHDIDSWLNRDQLSEVKVDDTGAQGIRQIGRVMLMANGNYARVYGRLSELLNKARNVAKDKNIGLKIYIIAGISGGTGSGTIVDFSYMVKRAISGFAQEYKKIDAIIFTPDVQFNDKGVDENKKKGLKANFYAAMKEIDFFFNNHARNVSYKCPYTEDESAYSEDIFDACTLISRKAQGVDIADNSNGVIKKVADAITFEISGIEGKTNKGDGQSYSAFFSNVYNNFQLWWPANSHGNGLDMPDWVPSRYSSLAYSSFYVPRDELIAYCANSLMEKLAEHWKQGTISENELKGIFRQYHIASNKSFAGRLFELAKCEEMFDVDSKELPIDGWGPVKVKNCCSYLDTMRSIAEQEGMTQRARRHLKLASQKQSDVFVAPIISLVDKAFTEPGKGPVYAINLLSAGISREYDAGSGILAWLAKLSSNLPNDASTWNLELQQVYDELSTKAESYDNSLSVDENDLNSFTDACRQYGEDLLKCKLLAHAQENLKTIYSELLDKNNRVFNIYTYAFEFLVGNLKSDSAYVTNTERHREGQTNIFSFDLTDFREDDVVSNRFKQYFESVVDTKDLDVESDNFVRIVFGGLKNLLDPNNPDTTPETVQPEDVIEIIRHYFRTSFADLTSNIIEKFCVVAYSTIDATPEKITNIWTNPQLKSVALHSAADAISSKILTDRRIMLSCADVTRDLQNFCSYETFAALPETKEINDVIGNPFILHANWSEFIGFKRIFGFPVSLIADLGDCKKEYDAQAITAGIHLDEMYSADDGFGDWRYALPEPYSYTTAKFLNRYEENGNDVTEYDRAHMRSLLKLAKEAKKLGLLNEKTNDRALVDAEPNHANLEIDINKRLKYYEIVYELRRPIADIIAKKSEIYSNLREAFLSLKNEGRDTDFFSTLGRAGYKIAEPVSIQWTFVRPEFNVMENRTDMGDDVNFGNFITLLRSNPYWEVKLKNGVKLFTALNEIYQTVLQEFAATETYNDRIISFMRAIRVGRVVPFNDKNSGVFCGFEIKATDNSEENIYFTNHGFEAFDKRYLLYLCFTEKYVKLEDSKIDSMNALVAHDCSIERQVDLSSEARNNVHWFIEHTDQTIKDPEWLAKNFDLAAKLRSFRDGLKHSSFSYSLPKPSGNKADVEIVIENLNGFYVELRDYLKANIPEEPIASSHTIQNNQPPVANAAPSTATWKCSCGATNDGKFCKECGQSKPVISAEWICVCGATNDGKFCKECGKPKPQISDVWTCSCGTVNDGKFCKSCGRPKGVISVICKKCGWKPAEGEDAGKFCKECGAPLN